MQGDGEIGGNCPGSGCPDDHVDLFAGKFGEHAGYIRRHRKFYIYGRCHMIGIFHLRLGEGRFARGTPVDWFFSLVNITAQQKFSEFLNCCRLIIVVHSHIRVIPFTKHAKPLELFSLNVNESIGVAAAEFSFLGLWHCMLFLTQFLVYLMFYGEAVAVPSRDIYTVKPHHVLRFYDNVLDDLVQRRTKMYISVSIRGAVMKDVSFPPLRYRPYFFIDIHLCPFFKHFRFLPSQICLH